MTKMQILELGYTDEDIKMSIQMQYDYSKNPDVFIGAEYGFVTLDKIKNGEA